MYEKIKDTLAEFLNRWSPANVTNMTINEYLLHTSDDCFTYWLDYKTTELGNIKGAKPGSIKFGLYKAANRSNASTRFNRDVVGKNIFIYKKEFTDYKDAFNKIKSRILDIIAATSTDNLDRINNIEMAPMVKWKIAFMYQDFKQQIHILPIYSHNALLSFLQSQPYWNRNNQTDMASLYRIAIANENIRTLDDALDFVILKVFGNKYKAQLLTNSPILISGRMPSSRKPPIKMTRNKIKQYSQVHKNIQTELEKYLKSYGFNVVHEWRHRKDHSAIDLVSEKNNDRIYYEIKPYEDVRACIREALGQLLEYMYYGKDITAPSIHSNLPKKLVIVGPNEIDIKSQEYLKILKGSLYNLPIEYRQFDLIKHKLY